jgi:F1F0 ATPase subunit 2
MSGAPVIAGSFAAGLMLGLGYFALLARTVRLFAAGADTVRAVTLYALRIGVAVAAFVAMAQAGAAPLIGALGGFVVARIVVGRRARFG